MLIAVLGTVVYDEISTFKGDRIESFGGITYNIAALSSLVDGNTRVCPVANVGSDRIDEARKTLQGYSGTECDLLVAIDQPNANVQLVYTSITDRTEAMWHVPPPLGRASLKKASQADAILLNFITGQELSLESLSALRSESDALIHMDVHNHISTWGEDGSRTITGFPDWADWFANVDTVQMNEMECGVLVNREVTEIDDFMTCARRFVEAGPEVAMITLGPLGSVMAYRHSDDNIYGTHTPAADLGEIIDTTGCGDSFSAGFVWNFISDRNALLANAAANIVGDINCITKGIGGLKGAQNARAMVKEVYPDLSENLKDGWKGFSLSQP